jgi:predicted phage-related endonuclease
MIKHLPPPTEAEEYRNMAEILRDLAAQVRFGNTRNELVNLANNLERLAAEAEHEVCGVLDWLTGVV